MSETLDTGKTESVENTGDSQKFEADASKMGWRPKEQFRGDPEKWVDAKTFVERGNEVLPIVKAELKKTRSELEEIRKAAQEWQEFTKAAHEREVKEWQGKYADAVRDKAAAITSGDGDKAIEAEARQRELEAARPQPKQQPKADPEFESWKADNDWYGTDAKKTLQANAIGATLAADGLRGRALYDRVAQEMQELEQAASGVRRQGPQRGGKPASEQVAVRSYENLKPEFRDACDKQFKYFGGKQTEDAWRKSWLSKSDETMFQGQR